MAYLTIANTIAEWDDNTPLYFTMREEVGPRDSQEIRTITIDLTNLKAGYTSEFLINLKQYLIERRHQVTLTSIKTEAANIQSLLTKIIATNLFSNPIEIIDENFLLSIASKKEQFAPQQLRYFRAAFKFAPHAPMFAKGLSENDFPTLKHKKGRHGAQIDRILAKALDRAAVAYILDTCDSEYAKGTMDLGHYSFAHLAFAVYVRPNSYRQIRVSDLTFDKTSNNYFIWITNSKTGEPLPNKVCFQINEPLGVLLTKQRQSVIAEYSHLIASDEIEKLALFPARMLKDGNSRWNSDYANQNFGAMESGSIFSASYANAISRKHFNEPRFNLKANTLRHTVGTLLAQTGASAKTISAVLKHSSDNVCRAYVDIAFHGMMETLSESMATAFLEHAPRILSFGSKDDPSQTQKQILTEDITNGQIEHVGECGKDVACAEAPISCYGCFRFRPCWDADHRINLNIVQREIDDMSQHGKPFQHLVDKAKMAKQNILMVMNAADRYQDAVRQGDHT